MAVLQAIPIYRALTQPQMFCGVTYTFFVLNGIVTTELFLISHSAWVLVAALVLHGVGYLASLREPRIVEIWIMRVSRCARTKTHGFWGCNSYGP